MRDAKNRGRRVSRAQRRAQTRAVTRRGGRPIVITAALWMSRVLLAATGLTLVAGGGMFGYRAVRDAGVFAVENVVVRTEPPVTRESVVTRAAIPAQSFLPSLDLEAVAQRVREDEWVHAVHVQRRWPQTVTIDVVPRHAWAVVQVGEAEFKYLDQFGAVFGDTVTSVTMRDGVAPLPVIATVTVPPTGLGSLDARTTAICRRLVKTAERSAAMGSVDEIVLGMHTITVYGGEASLEIVLPYSPATTIWDIDQMMARAERVLAVVGTHGPRRLDLRYTGRVAVRVSRVLNEEPGEAAGMAGRAKGERYG